MACAVRITPNVEEVAVVPFVWQSLPHGIACFGLPNIPKLHSQWHCYHLQEPEIHSNPMSVLQRSASRTLILLFAGALCLLGDAAAITPKTMQLGFVHDWAWDATGSRLVVNAGTDILVIDPDSGSVVDKIASNVSGQSLALSDDGQYLYIAVGSRGVIDRYQIQTHTMDREIALGVDSQGRILTAEAMVVLPGQPQTILVSRGYWSHLQDDYFIVPSQDVAVYDGAVMRKAVVAANMNSLYIRPSDGSINAWGNGFVFVFTVSADGVSVARKTPISPGFGQPSWNGGVGVDRSGDVYDLDLAEVRGAVAAPSGCALAADPAGLSILTAEGDFSYYNSPLTLGQYATDSFRSIASAPISGATDFPGGCDSVSKVRNWGTDGVAIAAFQHSGGGSNLVLFHAAGLSPVTLAPVPVPTRDASGIIRISAIANGLVYDQSRNLLWATIAGKSGQIGNEVISLDPGGNVVNQIFAGSEPGEIVLSNDSSMLFTISKTAPLISRFDLNSGTRAQEFTVVDSQYYTPGNMVPLPDSPGSIALIRFPAYTTYASNVAVFDNGTPRTKSLSNPLIAPGFGDLSTNMTAIYPGASSNLLYGTDLQSLFENGTHRIFQLRVDSDGIAIDRQLNSIPLGWLLPDGQMVVDNGTLFTAAGQRLTPDTNQLQGAYGVPGNSLPIPFADINRIVYLTAARAYGTSSLVEFEMDTMRPVASMQFESFGFTTGPQAAVRAGPSTVAVSLGGQILLIPLTSLTPWVGSSATVSTVAPGVQRMDLTVNSISSRPGTSQLVFTTPSKAGQLGNAVVTFDPSRSQVVSAVFAGSEPTLLAVTADGAAAYAKTSGDLHAIRVDLQSGNRDLVFQPDPTGGNGQYDFTDMLALPDGGIAMSFFSVVAVFDGATPRPQQDWDTQGAFAYLGGANSLSASESGDRLYAYDTTWSTLDSRRMAVSPAGVQWLSSTSGLPLAPAKAANGLLYTGRGLVIDPERGRVVGKFNLSDYGAVTVPDAANGHFFAASAGQIFMFDINSYALLGSVTLPGSGSNPVAPIGIARFGADGIAVATAAGQVFLVMIPAIPLLASPLPSPQPSLPATPGVTVVDLAANDLAYDPARNLIYAAIPNREGANGDQIVSIDPATGRVQSSWPGGLNPRLLSLSSDSSQLFFTTGNLPMVAFNNLSGTSESIVTLDPDTGKTGQPFPSVASTPGAAYNIADFALLDGSGRSVGIIDSLYQNVVLKEGTTALTRTGTYLGVYDGVSERTKSLAGNQFACNAIAPGATASRLYCSSGPSIYRLKVDADGVTVQDSFPLIPGLGYFGYMIFNGTYLFTSTGLVIDPEAKRTVTRVAGAQGPVAIDQGTLYWLDQATSPPSTVLLRSFDAATYHPLAVRQINVAGTNAARLIACGQGRLAFASGNQIYIVNPVQ